MKMDELSTHLFGAIQQCKLKKIIKCIDRGVNLNQYNYGETPLTWAIYRNEARADIIKYLILHGANINMSNEYNNNTPLTYAILMHRIDLVTLLLQHDAIIHKNDHMLVNINSNNKIRRNWAIKIKELLRLQPVKLQHRYLLNTAIALAPLKLPPYVVLWITDHNEETQYMTEIARIALIQNVSNRYSSIHPN